LSLSTMSGSNENSEFKTDNNLKSNANPSGAEVSSDKSDVSNANLISVTSLVVVSIFLFVSCSYIALDVLLMARPFGMPHLELLFYLNHFIWIPPTAFSKRSKLKKGTSTKASGSAVRDTNDQPLRSKWFHLFICLAILVPLFAFAILGSLAGSLVFSLLYAIIVLPNSPNRYDDLFHNAWEVFKTRSDQLTCRCCCEGVLRSELGSKIESALCYNDTNLSVASFSFYNRLTLFIMINLGIMMLKLGFHSIKNGVKERKLHKEKVRIAMDDKEQQPLVAVEKPEVITE